MEELSGEIDVHKIEKKIEKKKQWKREEKRP